MYAPGIIQVGGKTSRADQIVGILQEKTDISQILVKEDLLAHVIFQKHSDEAVPYQQYLQGIYTFFIHIFMRMLFEMQEIPSFLLLAHKDEGIYYQFVDSLHWNEKGSFYGYQILRINCMTDNHDIGMVFLNNFVQNRDIEPVNA